MLKMIVQNIGLALLSILNSTATAKALNTSSSPTGEAARSSCSCPPPSPYSLQFTNVYYDEKDIIAFFMAWLSLVPQFMCVMYLTLIFSRREAETILLLGGQILSEGLTSLLKIIIREERPMYGDKNMGYGLPSSHAQFLAYFTTYVTLWMYFRAKHFSRFKRKSRFLGLLSLTILVSYSRVYLFYHSWKQVLVGMTLGVCTGSLWFLACVLIRELGILEAILNTEPSRYFCIKDTSLYRSYVKDEFREWSRERIYYVWYYAAPRFYVEEKKFN
ncbi:hypothetical protein V1511DRAFT_301295 [Dipodascopsis uninucleata]